MSTIGERRYLARGRLIRYLQSIPYGHPDAIGVRRRAALLPEY